MLKAKEMFVTHGPWLVNGSLGKLKVLKIYYTLLKLACWLKINTVL